MAGEFEIRADYDRDSIVVYQAYSPLIGQPALAAKRFVPPFSLQRMTWIKPSFLWMMERSNWGQKAGQDVVVGVRIRRSGWEAALGQAELTSPSPRVYANPAAWRARFAIAKVHVQWDPERSIRGGKLAWRSIQVGLGRDVIAQYVDEWTLDIVDMTPMVKKILALRQAGRYDRAEEALPPERVYEVPEAIRRRLGMM